MPIQAIIQATRLGIELVAQGSTPRKNMVDDLSTAAANIELSNALSRSPAAREAMKEASILSPSHRSFIDMTEGKGGAARYEAKLRRFMSPSQILEKQQEHLSANRSNYVSPYEQREDTRLREKKEHSYGERKEKKSVSVVEKIERAFSDDFVFKDARGQVVDAATVADTYAGVGRKKPSASLPAIVAAATIGTTLAVIHKPLAVGMSVGVGSIIFNSGKDIVDAAGKAARGMATSIYHATKPIHQDVIDMGEEVVGFAKDAEDGVTGVARDARREFFAAKKEAGKMATRGLDAIGNAPRDVAQAAFDATQPYHRDIIKGGEEVLSSAKEAKFQILKSAHAARTEFSDAKNEMGKMARDIPTTFKELGKAFDEVKSSAAKYYKDLPKEDGEQLEAAWKEAKKIGDSAEREMNSIGKFLKNTVDAIEDVFSMESNKSIALTTMMESFENNPKYDPYAAYEVYEEKLKELEGNSLSAMISTPIDAIREGLQSVGDSISDRIDEELDKTIDESYFSALFPIVKSAHNLVNRIDKIKSSAIEDVQSQVLRAEQAVSRGMEEVVQSIDDTFVTQDEIDSDKTRAMRGMMDSLTHSYFQDEATAVASYKSHAAEYKAAVNSSSSYDEAVVALTSAVDSGFEKLEDAKNSVSSKWETAKDSLVSYSGLLDEVSLKSGRVWVEEYIRDSGTTVAGFWRKAAESIWGKKVKN